ncbi:metal-sensitive transcriptional regulator [Candidatus Aminicenantes bacterium AC-335-A11]|nr:metal-sensitive transcriptional regulator [SCandidatus Aminicenantes bacterium Aminicenantia_JdfR_composite]MCP2597102.1 metal-sensitive transcriptional regulator [Candidatus Aminicenantes bacterium AC-335-G13]MCP2598730.1 metal-sensitive transcriptional regulator [Candidatus Aminicenantes bacterium AC-335-L06]MCP2618762.1 metal-sensitive transcriptional regulator [Candidatus Aminicenantes bacterium AC-335-A11]
MEKIKEELIIRLKKIEGQIKGVLKMIEEGRDCDEILIQVASLRSAVNKIGVIILENYLKMCINKINKEKMDFEEIENFFEIFSKYVKN